MPEKRTRLSADVRREQILQVATELFIERGFADVKMGDIAEQLGTSRPNIYTYFPSTENILEALLEHYAREGVAVLKADLERNPKTDASEVVPLLVEQRELVLLLYCAGTPVLKSYREKVLVALTEYMREVLGPQLQPGQEQAFEELMVLQHNLYLTTAYTLLTQPGRYDMTTMAKYVHGMLTGGYALALPQIHDAWKGES